MTTSVPFTDAVSVVLDGAGNGTVKTGPLSAREVQYPQIASVKANANPTNEASCKIYVGATATDDNFVDGTFSGSSGDSTPNVAGSRLMVGQWVWAVWIGGDAGQTATLNVTGHKEI